MRSISCIVVDDEKMAREGIAHYVGQIPYLRLCGQCKSAIELDAVLLEDDIDLVLLDINMPGMSGLEWLKHARKPPMVILTTAHREYALDGYDLNVIDYLLKPTSFARFSQATLKAYQQVQKNVQQNEISSDADRYIFIKEDQQTIKIFLKDILYFEAAVDYIYIHTSEKRYMTLFSMKQVEEEVGGLSFLRIHRSYIINMKKVKMIKGHQVVIGLDELPVSRKLFQQVYDQLVNNTLWKES